tara:strand:+ start:39 stop:230 length:192 start_codon:yes stop_codon:yes gene_type:complete
MGISTTAEQAGRINRMGKVKGWMMEMEEDALHMDKGSWIEIHGEYYLPIWEEAQMQRLENDAE